MDPVFLMNSSNKPNVKVILNKHFSKFAPVAVVEVLRNISAGDELTTATDSSHRQLRTRTFVKQATHGKEDTTATNKGGEETQADPAFKETRTAATGEDVVETGVETSMETGMETSVETRKETSMETTMETSKETSVETPVETLVETLVETQVETRTEAAGAEVVRRVSQRLRNRGHHSSASAPPQPDVNYSIGSRVQINYKGRSLTKGLFLNATVTKLGDGDDPSMVVRIEPNQRHHGQLVTMQNRFDPNAVTLRRHNPKSQRRSMRPKRQAKNNSQRAKLRTRRPKAK